MSALEHLVEQMGITQTDQAFLAGVLWGMLTSVVALLFFVLLVRFMK